MDFLEAEIGSAKDNLSSPIHNWYKFTAGFSYKFVDEIISMEGLASKNDSVIYDPFAGCGTTLVSSQKSSVKAVGNEGQTFMYQIIKAKLNWKLDDVKIKTHLAIIKKHIYDNWNSFEIEDKANPLLLTLYKTDILKSLYLARNAIENIENEKYKLFFKLAISQTLHKVSIHPIAVPYISRKKTLLNEESFWTVFSKICNQMIYDVKDLKNKKLTSKVYLHDSRKPNRFIQNDYCNVCITSPPYLNNLDYGEVSKVQTHFFDITNNWNDITKKVRSKLVTGSTTHFSSTSFHIEEYLKSDFAIQNSNIIDELRRISEIILKAGKGKAGGKRFDVLLLLYFSDMFLVLSEMRRVLSPESKAFLILGDSAPYGVYVNTTELLGKISQNTGFTKYSIYKIRDRGLKWKSLKFRHSLDLTENVLILQ